MNRWNPAAPDDPASFLGSPHGLEMTPRNLTRLGLIVPNRGRGSGSVETAAPADPLFALGSETRMPMVMPSWRLVLARLVQLAGDPSVGEKMAKLLVPAMMRAGAT